MKVLRQARVDSLRLANVIGPVSSREADPLFLNDVIQLGSAVTHDIPEGDSYLSQPL